MVEAQAGGGHFVENGCVQMRVSVVGGFVPTVVVTHQKDDVGSIGSRDGSAEDDKGADDQGGNPWDD